MQVSVVGSVILCSLSPAAADDVRVTTIFASDHFESEDQNESNLGLGLEYQFTPDNWIGYTRFKNSDGRGSNMVSLISESRIGSSGFYLGVAAGAADNYQGGFGGWQGFGGISVRWYFLRTFVTPDVAAYGLAFSLPD